MTRGPARRRPSSPGRLVAALAIGAGLASRAASAADAPPTAPLVLEEFDDRALDVWKVEGLDATEHGAAGAPETWLDLKVSDGGDAAITRGFEAPQDWRGFEALVLRVGVPSGPPRPMRVTLRTGGPAEGGFVRRFLLNPGPPAEVVLPLRDFRDDGSRVVGDFGAVRRLRVRFDAVDGAPVGTLPAVRFDALALRPGAAGLRSCEPTAAQRLAVAFPDGGGVAHEGAHFVLLTDAPALRGDDGKRLVARLDAVHALATTAFGVDPGRGARAALYVAASREGYLALVARHAAHFGVHVAPPTSDGFTVMRRAFSSYDPAKGWDRPVYVHEAAHALLAETVGLACDGNWVHEGFATAVQARLHPTTVTAPYATAFGALARGERSPFRPLADALGDERPALRRYAQLATVFEFLAAAHAPRWPAVWAALREARGPFHQVRADGIAAALGTTPPALEAAWLAWGRATWPEPAPPSPPVPPPPPAMDR